MPKEQLETVFPEVTFPDYVALKLELRTRSLRVSWATPAGTLGQLTLQPSRADRQSEYRGEKKVRSWDQFRRFAVSLEPGRFIFRGQSHPRRLRTAFHRTKRKDLIRFPGIYPDYAAPVVRTQDEIEIWLTGPAEEALRLQRPMAGPRR